MLKKVLGVLFFLFGIFCCLSILGNILRLVDGSQENNNHGTIEIVTAIVFCVILGFFFFKYGLKWITYKKIKQDKIEDIGK